MIGSTIGDLYDRAVRYFGERTAISQADRAMTYAELGRDAERLLGALQEGGLAKGDTVAFLMANCAEYIVCEYAVAKAGAIRVPLAVLLASDDHVYMMNHAECTTLVYHASLADRVAEMLPKLKTVERFVCITDDTSGTTHGHLVYQELIESEAGPSNPVAIHPEDLAGIYFTGGTTGRPKGVMLSHRSWICTYQSEMLELGLGRDETFAFVTPLTHASGCLILPVLLRGGRCVILDGFDPQRLLATIARERITATFLVPTMIYVLLDHTGIGEHDLSSLRNVIYGAASIAPDRLKQALATFGPVMTQLFGQTEAPMMISVLSREDHVNLPPDRERAILSSAGRPTYHAEVRLLDEAGQEVPTGKAGEVVTRAANVMSGYLKDPKATAATVKGGWLHTGDIATQDDQGFLTIVDRKKDMIISGGFNIYPREIEDVLHDHPAVQNVAVIGVNHAKWGEEVRALVVPRADTETDEAELIAFVKERKGSLVAPKRVEFWESLPLTNLGKLDKKRMRAICQDAVQAPAP